LLDRLPAEEPEVLTSSHFLPAFVYLLLHNAVLPD